MVIVGFFAITRRCADRSPPGSGAVYDLFFCPSCVAPSAHHDDIQHYNHASARLLQASEPVDAAASHGLRELRDGLMMTELKPYFHFKR